MKFLIKSCVVLLYCIYFADCYKKARNEVHEILVELFKKVVQKELLSLFKVCYKAKTCIHNGVEKCGETKAGKYRRFLDSCDIMEYNCLKGTDYVKTAYSNCKDLPPIDDQFVDEVQWPKDESEAETEDKNISKPVDNGKGNADQIDDIQDDMQNEKDAGEKGNEGKTNTKKSEEDLNYMKNEKDTVESDGTNKINGRKENDKDLEEVLTKMKKEKEANKHKRRILDYD